VEIYQIVPLYILVAKVYHLSGFHTSLKMTPFQALYAFPPPHVAEMFLADDTNEDAETMLQRRQEENITIKANLQQAQERMVHYANKNRSLQFELQLHQLPNEISFKLITALKGARHAYSVIKTIYFSSPDWAFV
jgi:hypothetical protein